MTSMVQSTSEIGWLITGSIYQASDLFVLNGEEAGIGLILLGYDTDQPAIVVSFRIGTDGAISMAAQFAPLTFHQEAKLMDQLAEDDDRLPIAIILTTIFETSEISGAELNVLLGK